MLLVQSLNSVFSKKLAILICHLLIGGKFQLVQIFFNSETFNDQLICDLNSNCLNQISWMTNDNNNLEISQWNNTIKSDHIIQLIFTDSDGKSVERQSKQPQNYYRLFVFHSNSNVSLVPEKSNKATIQSDSNTIGIFHDESGVIKAHLLHDDFTLFHKAINDLNEPMTSAQVFDKVFSEREKLRKLGVFDSNFYCKKHIKRPSLLDFYFRSLQNYLFAQKKMDFIELSGIYCSLTNGRYFRPISQRIYSELSWNLERISNNETEV